MILDEETLLLFKSISDGLRRSIPNVADTNILKKPLIDWCDFVDSAKVGDDMWNYVASTVAAFQISGAIPKELADQKLDELMSIGVYGAWTKSDWKERLYGLLPEIDSWIEAEIEKKGDLRIPEYMLDKLILLRADAAGGVQ